MLSAPYFIKLRREGGFVVGIFVDVATAFDNLTFNALHYLLCQVRKKTLILGFAISR